MNESCKTCRFRDESRGVWGKVQCRRYPPTYRENGEWLFPLLNTEGVCGEWQVGEPLVVHRDLRAQVVVAEAGEWERLREELGLRLCGDASASWQVVRAKLDAFAPRERNGW